MEFNPTVMPAQAANRSGRYILVCSNPVPFGGGSGEV